MAGNSLWYDATAIASVGAVCNLFGTAATMKIYTTPQPALDGSFAGTLLVTLGFANPIPFSATAASTGTVTATAGAITSGTAVSTGTAAAFGIFGTTGATIATGNVSTTAANLNLNSTVINSGAVVSITAFTITQSQTGT